MRLPYRYFLLLLILVAAVPSRLDAAPPENRLILPGLANVSGANGTRFESTVWGTNLGSDPATLELGFIPFQGVGFPARQIRVLGAGETLRFNNALLDLFGLEGTGGTLTAESDQPFDLRAVTANVADPTGTYGLSLESVSPSKTLVAGQSGHSIWLSHSADSARGSRTNVTVALTAPNSTVTVSIYDANHVLRGLKVISSEVPMTWQASTAQLVNDPEIPIGRVKYAVTAGKATGYTSVIDNITGDGFVVQSERPDSGPADLLLDGVARTSGANNTHFVTDVRLLNPNDSSQQVTIDALGFAGGVRTISRTIAPNGILEILDILGPDGINLPDGVAGALRFRAPLPVLVAGRTRNIDPTGKPGTFSTFQRAIRYDNGFITTSSRATLIGLNQSSSIPGFRSNIALFSGPNGVVGTLRLCDRLGAEIATRPFSFGPSQWQQQRITSWFPDAQIPTDARVGLLVSNGSLHGYAAVVDNKTGDGVVVAPIPIQSGSPCTATKLAFTTVPSSVTVGTSFSVMVQALRPNDNVDPSFSSIVQLALASGPGNLQGSNSQSAVAGIATFENLSLSAEGTYTLMATADGLSRAVSDSIIVTAASPTAIKVGTFVSQNGYTTTGTLQILRTSDGTETLMANSDFHVSSGAGSISIYLARSSGPLNTKESVKLGTLTERFSGEFTFPIPAPGSIGYSHVITYCDAFQVNFGAAELRNP